MRIPALGLEQRGKDPIDALIGIVQGESVRPEDVRGGWPLNNLAQQISPLDEGFGIASALRDGQTHGRVRRDVEPAETAGFLIATVEVYVSLEKNAQDAKVLKVGIRNIVKWLRSLRAPNKRTD